MRILHCVFTRAAFGSERYCADLSMRQQALGHDVSVAVEDRSALIPLIHSDVRVHLMGRLFRRARLAALLRRERADIIHAHLGLACKALGGMTGRPPAVATLHVGYKPHQHANLDGLIALTARDAAAAASFKGLVVRIGNWIPEMPNLPPSARNQMRAELGIADDTYVVGFIGRLHPSKNPEALVRAYRAANLKNAVLVIAGEGPARGEVEGLAAGDPSVRVLGYRDDAARLYRAFDLFALPSRFDPFPLVLLEAMGAGLPIVTTRIEGPADFMPSPPAHLFASEDEAALTEILRAEHARGQRRERYDLTPFDRDRQLGKIADFYEAVRAARAPSDDGSGGLAQPEGLRARASIRS